jgi:hypothetical protein
LLTGKFPEHANGCPKHPATRQLEGCDAPTVGAPAFELEIDGERTRFERCPLFYVDDAALDFLRWWRRARANLWPEGSRGLDNSATFLDAFDLLERSLVDFAPSAEGE